MLTKDLIRCRIERGQLKPRFVPEDDPALLGLAERLLQLYGAEPPPTRGDLAETTQALLAGQSDTILAKGLNKIVLDRCEFSHVADCDFQSERDKLFRLAGKRLREGIGDEPAAFRARVLEDSAVAPALLDQGIYADLPENEVLERFRSMTPPQLLQRYNVGLVQALLLRSHALELTLDNPDAANMRRMFKYLKFFRLLARMYQTAEKESDTDDSMSAIRVTIDGPTSVLANPKRYGLQLASFFPAVCLLKRWSLQCRVRWKNQDRTMHLSERCGLVSHYRNFSAYVPEEIQLFHRHFRETVDHWRIVGHTPFLRLQGQEIVFPDLSFQHAGGAVVHLELFHRWHAGQLLERLNLSAEREDLPLIIGVDRALLNDTAVQAACDQNPWFEQRGFLFRDYPSVDRAVTCLDRVVDGASSAVETQV